MGFLLPTLVLTAAGVLLHAGVGHTWRADALGEALHRQALLGPGAARIVRLGLGPTEVLLALAAAMALVTGTAAPAAGTAVAALGAAFLAFLLALARWRPTAPCGCADDGRSAGPAEAGRAAVVLGGGLALLVGADGRWVALTGSEAATVLAASFALTLAVELATSAAAPRLVTR